MDRIRFSLWFGLLAAVWLSYATWMEENQPEAPVADSPPAEAADPMPGIDTDDPVPGLTETGSDATVGSAIEEPAAERELITVRTDVLDLEIDLNGGDIVRADLPVYPVHKDQPDVPVRLLDYSPENRWIFQSGMVAGSRDAPDHRQTFTADADSYTLANGQDSLEVRLQWSSPEGIVATKTYTFRRGQYAIDLELAVTNNSQTPYRTRAYAQMSRVHHQLDRSFLNVDSYSFTGPAYYDGESYDSIKFDNLGKDPINETVTNGWVASIQHHFLAAIIPILDEQAQYQSRVSSNRYLLTATGAQRDVANGATFSYPFRLFVGPKLQDQLEEAAPGRELTRSVDYGMLFFLSQPLFWLLDLIHGFVGNWGWSIVLTTIIIKMAFYWLTATSGRSMAKMRKVAPRMKALQEKHKDDRQALSAAMMDLYKKEKINPAAGCLPILIQMPFFFAFYWVLIESVEMRQAPFLLWINDLSVRDPFFILPMIMFGAMFFQMRLNPSPPDPVQARVMQIMPFVFAAMFALFPAGLVLYWLTNTLFSIAQQWRINKLVERES